MSSQKYLMNLSVCSDQLLITALIGLLSVHLSFAHGELNSTRNITKIPFYIPFADILDLIGNNCSESDFQKYKIKEWWDNYFENGTFKAEEFQELYDLDEKATEPDFNSKTLAELCLSGYRLYECVGGKCECRPDQTTPFVLPTFHPMQENNITHCLIQSGKPCAMKVRPRDYELFRLTRRACVADHCCIFDWPTGKSECKPCSQKTRPKDP